MKNLFPNLSTDYMEKRSTFTVNEIKRKVREITGIHKLEEEPQGGENKLSDAYITRYKRELMEVIFNSTSNNTVWMLPKELIKEDLFEAIMPQNTVSALHNAVRLGYLSGIPSGFFSADNVFAIQGDGKNMISFILGRSSSTNNGLENNTLLSLLINRIPLRTMEAIHSAYPELKNRLRMEKMRRIVNEERE
jgi:hypothetical protein